MAVVLVAGAGLLGRSLLRLTAVDEAGLSAYQDFVVSVGFSDFNVDPGQLFKSVVVGGGLMIVVSTGFALLGSILFLITAAVSLVAVQAVVLKMLPSDIRV